MTVGTVVNVAILNVNVTKSSVTRRVVLATHPDMLNKHVSTMGSQRTRVNAFTRLHVTRIVVDQTWGTLLTHQVKEKTEIGALTQLHHGDQWLQTAY